MKKLLSILAISVLVGSASTTVISCDEEESSPATGSAVALSSVITEDELPHVKTSGEETIPSKTEILKSVKYYNKDVDETKISVDDGFTASTATVSTADGLVYTGKVDVTFTSLVKTKVLKDLLVNTELTGTISAGSIGSPPSIKDVEDKLYEANPDAEEYKEFIDVSDIQPSSILFHTRTREIFTAKTSADGLFVTGDDVSLKLTYTVSNVSVI